MTDSLSADILSSLSRFLAAQMGLHYPPNRWGDLDRGIRAIAKVFGFERPQACAEWLLASPLSKSQIEALASQLTVVETYFYREPQTFEALEAEILPELINNRAADRRLRLWSAGCATGEEAYSLAILLSRLIPRIGDWNVSILATDINTRALKKASDGVYSTWSFRGCPAEFSRLYFDRIDDRHFKIRPEIKKMVSLSNLNLVEALYPSLVTETNALDLIFCRNVMMYFPLDQTGRVIERFHRCLVDGGWLAVSVTEASHTLFSQFRTVNFPGTILYRKDDHDSRPMAFAALDLGEEPQFAALPVPSGTQTSEPRERHLSVLTLPKGDAPSRPPFEKVILPAREAPSPASEDPFEHYQNGRYSQALDAVGTRLDQNPDDAKSMALKARILANRGELTEALEWCDKAITAEKLEPGLYYLRATILQEQGGTGEAVTALKRAVYLNQRFVLAHFALGNLHRSMGMIQEARKQFENAMSLLHDYQQADILPESEGITAGRLREIIATNRGSEGV